MNQKIYTIKLKFVNSYLIKEGSDFILIDTGFAGSRAELEKGINGAGCFPGNLNLIIITHGDSDHSGNASFLCEKYKAKIAMHKEDSSMAEDFEIQMNSLKNRRIRGLISSIIFKASLLIANFPFVKKRMLAEFKSFKPDLYLEDGQNLLNFGLNAKVIHIPGHTKGSIGILLENGDFIAGDILRNITKPALSPLIENLNDLDSSIERLKKMDIKMVYPGHGKPFIINELFQKH